MYNFYVWEYAFYIVEDFPTFLQIYHLIFSGLKPLVLFGSPYLALAVSGVCEVQTRLDAIQ
jgi:hypothetical protein